MTDTTILGSVALASATNMTRATSKPTGEGSVAEEGGSPFGALLDAELTSPHGGADDDEDGPATESAPGADDGMARAFAAAAALGGAPLPVGLNLAFADASPRSDGSGASDVGTSPMPSGPQGEREAGALRPAEPTMQGAAFAGAAGAASALPGGSANARVVAAPVAPVGSGALPAPDTAVAMADAGARDAVAPAAAVPEAAVARSAPAALAARSAPAVSTAAAAASSAAAAASSVAPSRGASSASSALAAPSAAASPGASLASAAASAPASPAPPASVATMASWSPAAPAAPVASTAQALPVALAAPSEISAPAVVAAGAAASAREVGALEPLEGRDPPEALDAMVENSPAPLADVGARAETAVRLRAEGERPAQPFLRSFADAARSADGREPPTEIAIERPLPLLLVEPPGALGAAHPSSGQREHLEPDNHGLPAVHDQARGSTSSDAGQNTSVGGGPLIAPPTAGAPATRSTNGRAPAPRRADPGANPMGSGGLMARVSDALRSSAAAADGESSVGRTTSADLSLRVEAALEVAAVRTDGTMALPSAGLAGPDGALTTEPRPAVAAAAAPLTTGTDLEGARERGRSAVVQAADHRVLRRGLHAEVDLGEAGRVFVHAENPGARLEVRLDADANHTARALAQHAGELASELRADGRSAVVTVTGPSTQASSSGGTTAGAGTGSGNGNPSRREREEHGEGVPTQPARVGPGRRARFVL